MPDTITTDQLSTDSAADKVFRDAVAEIDAENRATAEGANWFDEFTNLEEALHAAHGVAQILIELGTSKSSNQFETDIPAYLGGQLLDHYEDARDAFEKLHALHCVSKKEKPQT
jgi:hypothetical protein